MNYFNLIFIFLFSSINLFSGSHSHFQEPKMKVKQFKIHPNSTSILLNNGTEWIYDDTDIARGSNGWKEGDQVEVAYSYWDDYYLQNKSRPGAIPVRYRDNDGKVKVQTIQKIIKKKPKEHTLILSDNSRWHVGIWSSRWLENWRAGDQVMVTGHDFLYGDATHLLINLNRSMGSLRSNVRAQILNASPKSRKNPEAKTHTLKLHKTWKKKNGVMLKLSNKMVLQCKRTKKQWKKGDAVSLEYGKGFELSNLRNDEELKARVVKSRDKSVKTLVIQKIADNGKKIVLSDGSTWLLYHLPKLWNIGDRIVVSSMSMGINMSTHQLLNLDALNGNKKKNCCRSAVLMK